jgi:hypothetical protein
MNLANHLDLLATAPDGIKPGRLDFPDKRFISEQQHAEWVASFRGIHRPALASPPGRKTALQLCQCVQQLLSRKYGVARQDQCFDPHLLAARGKRWLGWQPEPQLAAWRGGLRCRPHLLDQPAGIRGGLLRR